MTKKILLIFLAFALSICLFSCSSSNEESRADSDEASLLSREPTEESVLESSESAESIISEETSEESFESIAAPAFSDSKFYKMTELNYVALGDSIARGYGLADPLTMSYPALLTASLDKVLVNTEVSLTNYAIDGLTTQGLIQLLNDGCESVDDADLISVCIGANNLLQPFLRVVEKHMPSLVNQSPTVDNDALSSSVVTDAIKAIEAEIEGEGFALQMSAGVEALKSDLVYILDELGRRAPDADIVIMTVYSPYNGINLSVPYLDISFDMGSISDKWVSEINKEIRRIADEKGCVLVDTYDYFQIKGNLVNASLNLSTMSFSFDPHPNFKGHAELSNLHLKAIKNI